MSYFEYSTSKIWIINNIIFFVVYIIELIYDIICKTFISIMMNNDVKKEKM